MADKLQTELAKYARKIAEERLTFGSSGNISAKAGKNIFIKTSGTSFECAKPADFVRLGINSPPGKNLKRKPSIEYRMHIAAYKMRPDVKAVFHTHPLITTALYSAGIKQKPVTMEFALYIGKSIIVVPFASPGSARLAERVARALKNHDAVIIKKHGLVTVGSSMQEAFLKALIIERESRARFLCRLFRKVPPYLTNSEINSLKYI